MKWVDDIAYAMRALRIVSISVLIFNSYLINQFLQWVMKSDPSSLGEAAAVTGIMGALVALMRFIFNFATFNQTDNKH